MNTRSLLLARHFLSAIAALALTGNHSAFAAARTWTGDGSTANFTNGGNWDGSTDIADGDSLTFGALGAGDWTFLSNNLTVDWTVAGMTFDAGAVAYTMAGNAITLTGDIANNNTATQTINLEMTLSGTRTVTAFGGSEIILGGQLKDPSGASGGLTKTGSGTLTLSGTNTFTGATTVSAGTLVISGSSGPGTVTVGESSGEAGALEITGGTLASTDTTLGKAANSQGTVTVSNNGSWTNAGTLYVGDAGTGILNISGGTVTVVGSTVLGNETGSEGTVTVSGGESHTNALAVGYRGSGTLNISGGAVTSLNTVNLGVEAGSQGTVNVSGGSWTSPSGITVGYWGNGTLNITGGSVIGEESTAMLGMGVNSQGTATVSGNGSWSTLGLYVGYQGRGTVLVEGGILNSGIAYLGVEAGSEGMATVSGGTWTNSSIFYLGGGGNGTLLINGGSVTSGAVLIGGGGGTNGTVNVSGGTLSLSGMEAELGSMGAIVGYVGTGVLNITGTGSVSVLSGNGTVMLAMSGPDPEAGTLGSVGTLNIGNGGAAGSLDAAEVTGGEGTAVVNFNHNEASHTFAPNLTGSLSVNQIGTGKTVLTGTNTYTGATTVSAGTLVINGSNGPGAVTVAYGATLGGNGTVGGDTTISGTHTPGNSPGLQTFESNLTYENGATVVWELSSNTIAGRGTNFDGINVNGDLTINATTALNLVFNGSGSTVDWTNDLWATDQAWLFFSVGGTTLGTLTMGVISADMNGVFLGAVRPNAGFSVTSSGDNILVSYTAIPEPSTLLLVALSGIAGLLARRRKGDL